MVTAEVVPTVPFDSFMRCFLSRHRKAEVAYTMVSLLYGKTTPNSSCFRVAILNPVLKRFVGVFRHALPYRSVEGPGVRYSGFAGHDRKGRDGILLHDFLGPFRLRYDHFIHKGKFNDLVRESNS